MAMRVLLVDDSPRFLDAATTLLQSDGFEVVGVASAAAEALSQAARLDPDVVLVDIHLGAESGLDLARQLPARVVLMSTHAEADFADLIAASPAAGFVAKDALSPAAVRRLLDAG